MTDRPEIPQPRIIATLGPASLDRPRELASAGADAFRLNASHMSPEGLSDALSRLRDALPAQPVIVDIQGAKMRLGSFEERPVRSGQRLQLALNPEDDATLPLPHPEFFAGLKVGDTLSCDDDRIRFRVVAKAVEQLEIEAQSDGVLRAHKGINCLQHPLRPQDLSPRDVAHLEVVRDYQGVAIACSFMTDGSEAAWIRRRLPGAAVIGKVERAEALENLSTLVAWVQGVWICRGDLGAQIGSGRLAVWVGRLEPRTLGRPVWMAGQVLEHLTHHPLPTRSEICHLYDLLRRGYAGIVLSDETAIGIDPIGAVRQAASLLRDYAEAEG